MSDAPAAPRRRVADLLALALVATSVTVVTAAAAPSVARELGLTRASLSRHEPAGHGVRSGGATIGSPHRPGSGDLFAASDDDDDDPSPGDARLAVAVRDLVVRELADERAASRGAVPRGELLIVIREAGAWAMVAHLGGEGSTTGWVRRGDLAIR